MPRPRDPRRDKAKKQWLKREGNIKLVDLAEQFDVSSSTIRKWKATDQWEKELKGSAPKPKKSAPKPRGAPPGNQNAKGNPGGAAPYQNKNAVTTGEYETIFEDVLSDEERSLFHGIDTSPLLQLEENIRILSIRERRMLQRIKDAMNGLTQKEKRVLQELQSVKEPMEVYDDKSGETKIVTRNKQELVVTEIAEKEYRKIDDILKIEDALTRVQGQKMRTIKLKHEIETQFNHRKLLDEEKLVIEKAKAKVSPSVGQKENPLDLSGLSMEELRELAKLNKPST
ncbi:phage terminase small subunit [Halobacillus salinarum]|uniref:Phage terminase small subunit n=1 Tax=Halobacillus salinarum TaxID=2932257 RepID=A0ABY4EIB5_9BACI|nr:phage terminase small subunit [Halobacillus salinarum]UOQ43364.1 phage terminase small subunit [Halobacillus salinarum]